MKENKSLMENLPCSGKNETFIINQKDTSKVSNSGENDFKE